MRPCADDQIVEATYAFRLIVSSFGQVKRVLLNYQEGGSETQRDCLTKRLKEVRFPADHTVGDRSYGIAFAWMP